MSRTTRIIIVASLTVAGVLAGDAPVLRAEQESEGTLVPACFLTDTIYHMVLHLERKEFELWYGLWQLTSCPLSLEDDAPGVREFVGRWRSPGKAPWQTVKRRGVWSGRPAVSDTVIKVVSEVAHVDPDLIKRVYPDRFRVDLTGGFCLLILTSKGSSEGKGIAETWNDYTSRMRAFGRLESLTIIVNHEDAQTLYYALEPGTPVLLHARR